ncbi:UDP-4-amino-4,6-dideoxy-N-acetyl-beta-L-altrosamine transaminase [Candidatus Methylopumilus planktonicus]|uniref:UDP-4-amino-4, 6-dideoxy-N-acetyl-beta-L-altrosamine transaminase n=1 Tax=Candidatus Methylopumilus planktonicus TaxID=1581557 RepID=UPI003D18DCE2
MTKKTMITIPYARQEINEADIDAVVSVLKSEFLTQGSIVSAFEKSVADYCDAKHAISVNSATSALHIACLALGVGKGDIVWTSPITFVASANCALYCGAEIDFVDIDPYTYNLSVECLSKKLELAEKNGKLPKVLIPVHLCGQSPDMASIYALSKKYGFKIIEDASHAIGGKYKGELIGNCRYSHITVFSFHPVKIITTGEGGMLLTNQSSICKSISLFRSHGITSERADMLQKPAKEIWNYQQIELGFNYRMSDIHAALGLSQMKRLDEFVTKRHIIANNYDQLLSNLPIFTPFQNKDSYSSYHLYLIRLKLHEITKSQKQVYEDLRNNGIMVNLHYIPVYRQPYYKRKGFKVGYCPNAESYFSEVLTLPMYPALEKTEQDHVIKILSKVLEK